MTYRGEDRRTRSTLLLVVGGALLALAAAAAGNRLGTAACGLDRAPTQRITLGSASRGPSGRA